MCEDFNKSKKSTGKVNIIKKHKNIDAGTKKVNFFNINFDSGEN